MEQAELAISFHEKKRRHYGAGHPKTEAELALEETDRILMKGLNRKGKSKI